MVSDSVVATFGDGDAGGLLVDDRGLCGECRGQGVHGEVVHRSGVAAGGVVNQRDRIIGEQRIGPAGDLGVMGDVVGGIGWCYSGQRVADRDPLIERCEDTETQPMPQVGLSDQQRGEW